MHRARGNTNIQFEKKKGTGKYYIGSKSSGQGDKKFEESLIANEIKGMVPSGQDSTKISLQLVKRMKGKLKPQRKPSAMESWCKCDSRKDQVPDPASRTWQLQPCGSGFKVKKDTGNGLWNLPLRPRKAAIVRCATGKSLHGGQRGHCLEL